MANKPGGPDSGSFDNWADDYLKTRLGARDPAPPEPPPPAVPLPATGFSPVRPPGRVACPKCGATLQTATALPGEHRVRCPHCGTPFAIAMDSQATPVVPKRSLNQGTNRKGLWRILAGLLVVGGGGTALVIYLLSGGGSSDKQQVSRENSNPEKPKDGTPPKPKDAPTHESKDDAPRDQPAVKDKVPTRPQSKPLGPLVRLAAGQQATVDRAVARGVSYLKFQQNPNGTWTASVLTMPRHTTGLTALVGLTLLECDVPQTDPHIQKVAAHIRGREKSQNKIFGTYELSLAILFLDHLGAPQDQALIRDLALRLVAGQRPSGGWTYNCPVLAKPAVLATLLVKTRGQLSANTTTSRLVLKPVAPSQLALPNNQHIPDRLANLPVWRDDIVLGDKPDSDNSNTQFALLALWAARTRGVPVDRTLARAVLRFHKTQNADGSWGYEEVGPRTAMSGTGTGRPPLGLTCAGLLGLAAGQGLVNDARGAGAPPRKAAVEQDPAIKDALNFLARDLGDPHRPWRNAAGAPLVDLYYLWSLERVGVVFQLPKIGDLDWFGWGAEKLVAHQTVQGDQGFWPQGLYYAENPAVNTCFALLFLKQANLAKDLTAKLVVE